MGGCWTRSAVSSTVRWRLLLAARARTSEKCGRRDAGKKSKRSVGGEQEESNDKKWMVAQHTGLVLGAVFVRCPVNIRVVLDASEEVAVAIGFDHGW